MKLFEIPMLVTSLVGLCLVSGLDTSSVYADFTFGERVNLKSAIPVLDPAHDWIACFSHDGLEMYISSGVYGEPRDLQVLRRASIDDDWGPPENLGPVVNSLYDEESASISADGLTLYFNSNRPGGYGSYDIWMTTRATKSNLWGPPVNLGSNINSYAGDDCPVISTDGLELYFVSWRAGGYGGGTDIYVTRRATTNDPWGKAVNLGPVVNSAYGEGAMSLSADGLLLLFADYYQTPRPGGYGSQDIWMTRRANLSAHWEAPVNLGPTVNGLAYDWAPCISPDGRTLYCATALTLDPSTWDYWQVPILPVVDFYPDWIVNMKDFSKLAQYWGQYEPSVDIGPMPWGDGIVDGRDMAVFAEYWLSSTLDPATNPNPADASAVAPLISDSNVYVVLDYTPGQHAIKHTGYFSDNIDDVNNRVADANLGFPPRPAISTTAFYVGYDLPDIPEFARVPLVRGTTYYWCVDEFDGFFTWAGQVWSFLVMPVEAWGPSPEDGATSVVGDPNVTLSWSLGDLETEGYTVSYIVYFGSDEPALGELDTVEPTSYDVSGRFMPLTTYYWRIDTKRMLDRPPFTVVITPGNIWRFTTGP